MELNNKKNRLDDIIETYEKTPSPKILRKINNYF